MNGLLNTSASQAIVRAGALAAAMLLLATAASAELGGPAASVHADAARMGGKADVTDMGHYQRYALTRANGGTVHELTNGDGQVFAVTWSGPGKPDLRSLLGNRFAAFQAAGAGIGPTMHALRRPVQINQPDLRIATEGHLGWFRGAAFIPSLAPAGFSLSDLQEER